MKIYHSIDEFVPLKNAVVTIGTFDGVHIGHRKIISGIKELAESTGGETVLLTFFPHPRMILHPEDESLKLINTINEKAELLGLLQRQGQRIAEGWLNPNEIATGILDPVLERGHIYVSAAGE